MTVLDNPVWHALNTEHQQFAIGGDLAKRYPEHMTIFGGLAEMTLTALTELAIVTPAGHSLLIFNFDTDLNSPDWEIIVEGKAKQMVCTEPVTIALPDVPIVRLTDADLPAIFELIEIAQPGPFLPRTIEMGDFFGIKEDGRLVAMAGTRMFLTGYKELTAVATHPDARGRGYGAALVAHVSNRVLQAGLTPFLHVVTDNTNAIRLYEKLGFVNNQIISGAFIRRLDTHDK